MTYADWLVGETAYYGPAGALVPIPIAYASRIGDDVADRWVSRTALSGAVKAQRLPRQRRTWNVELEPMTEAELGGIFGLALAKWPGQSCHWVSPDMTNLLGLKHATLDKSGDYDWVDWIHEAGPVTIDGMFFPNSIWVEPGKPTARVTNYMPVLAGTKVTGSAWMQPSGSFCTLNIIFQDSTGAFIQARSITSTDPTLSRWGLTVDVPEGATTAHISVLGASNIVGIQFQWGEITPYCVPTGCPNAVIQGVRRSLEEVDAGVPWWSVSFNVQEVG